MKTELIEMIEREMKSNESKFEVEFGTVEMREILNTGADVGKMSPSAVNTLCRLRMRSIREFREANRDCVSTTHSFDVGEFTALIPYLRKRYKAFRAEFVYPVKRPYGVNVTIPTFKTKP